MNAAFIMVEHDGSAVGIRLARNLRRLRIARQLSLSELARATGMSKATLSSIENGRANPTVDTLASLAAALRVALVELLAELPARGAGRSCGAGPGRRTAARPARAGPRVAVVRELALPARELRELRPLAPGPAPTSTSSRAASSPARSSGSPNRPRDYAVFPADVPHQLETAGSAARILLMLRERRGSSSSRQSEPCGPLTRRR